MKPPIKDAPKEDKPPNKGHTIITMEDNLPTKDKMPGPNCVHVINWRFSVIGTVWVASHTCGSHR